MVDAGETICDCKCYRAGIEAAADELTALRAKVAAGNALVKALYDCEAFGDEADVSALIAEYDAAVGVE